MLYNINSRTKRFILKTVKKGGLLSNILKILRFFYKLRFLVFLVLVILGVFVLLDDRTETLASSKAVEEIPVDPDFSDGSLLIKESRRPTHIVEYMQEGLDRYIKANASPIAGAIVVDVKTGNIIAFSQGRSPSQWEGSTDRVHTLLHPKFPAASLFKTVVTSAVLDIYDLSPDKMLGLTHGCGNVQPTGSWLIDEVSSVRKSISLRKAYGNSCNAFFAKLAVNTVGVDAITKYAEKFGWNKEIPADFQTRASTFNPPSVTGSSVQSVGKYAAGFGMVGLSPVHAAWQTLAIANDGVALPLSMFKGTDKKMRDSQKVRVIPAKVALTIKDMMSSTVNGGTASFAFRRGKYRALRHEVGGKTGTLSGKTPEGINTWFAGMYPINNPEIVVVTIVVLEDLWHIKAAHLAAEAFSLWKDYKKQLSSMTALNPDESRSTN